MYCSGEHGLQLFDEVFADGHGLIQDDDIEVIFEFVVFAVRQVHEHDVGRFVIVVITDGLGQLVELLLVELATDHFPALRRDDGVAFIAAVGLDSILGPSRSNHKEAQHGDGKADDGVGLKALWAPMRSIELALEYAEL